MLIAIGLLVLAGGTVSRRLSGEHVCQEERRFTVNVTEYFIRNSTVRNYKWCMNVPPRCSFYTTRFINDSRIVEREVTDLIDKCCSGYIEDKASNRCAPVCPDCFSGNCTAGKCSCFPGYKGDRCDSGCDATEWGANCKFQCACNGSSCHPATGKCVCAPGWTGNSCELSCEPGFYGSNCQSRCSCDLACDPVTGHCDSPTTASSENPQKINFSFSNNGKFEIDRAGLLSTTTHSESTETPFPFDQDQDERIGEILSTHTNGVYASTPTGPVQITKSKAKVKSKEVSVTGEENFLSDDAQRGNADGNKNDLVNGASAATAICVGIIIVAGVIVAANHFKKNKEKEEGEGSKRVSTVAVYTHSIFHTPLPEPPIFENPIFTTPAETTPANEGRFETHVVCSMNFPAPINPKDPTYLYDHPPSTGSYRAASIPEPPDGEMNQSVTHPEPLYDEIPSGMVPTPISQPPPSYKSSSLYMNTFGKTRF